MAKIRSFLSTADKEILIRAIVSSRLDYCYTLLSGLSGASTKMVPYYTILIFTSLAFYPNQIRLQVASMMTYKFVNCLPPSYLSDLIIPHIQPVFFAWGKKKKKKASKLTLSYHAPFLSNNFPVNIRQSGSAESF